MVKIIETIEHEFNSCRECPFCKSGYTGGDGFGMGATYDAHYCEKGYFGKVTGKDFNGSKLWDPKVKVPKCIPLYCEFSDKKYPSTIQDLLKCNMEEIIDFFDAMKNRKYQMQKVLSENIESMEKDKRAEKAWKKHAEYVNKVKSYLKERGYNVIED